MIFIAVLMLVTALLGMILFDMQILFGILMILCAAGVLINELVLKKKIQKNYIRYMIFGALTAAFLVCALLPGSRLAGVPAADANHTASVVGDPAVSDEDAGHLKAAREYVGSGEYDSAERELNSLSEEAKRTEDYYLLYSDIRTGKKGFDEVVDPSFLRFLMDGVRDHPESLLLNYKTGIAAYAINRYIIAESYLSRAYELAPEDDPYTPYALAAVYKQLGEDEYAYAFMTIAEKNGMLSSGECGGEGLVDWYNGFKKELKEKEAAK